MSLAVIDDQSRGVSPRAVRYKRRVHGAGVIEDGGTAGRLRRQRPGIGERIAVGVA